MYGYAAAYLMRLQIPITDRNREVCKIREKMRFLSLVLIFPITLPHKPMNPFWALYNLLPTQAFMQDIALYNILINPVKTLDNLLLIQTPKP